jgi:predicted kinase
VSKLIIMAGIPGTGKSTWAHRFFDPASIVSSDAIRVEIAKGGPVPHSYGSERAPYDPSLNAQVFAAFVPQAP